MSHVISADTVKFLPRRSNKVNLLLPVLSTIKSLVFTDSVRLGARHRIREDEDENLVIEKLSEDQQSWDTVFSIN